MANITYREALTDAIALEMERDETVVVIGEDVSGGRGTEGGINAIGGIFGLYPDFVPRFGEDRVIDTPISENAIVGAAAGAALGGLRPVAEIMFADFLGLAMDQLYNQAAKFRYMFGGKTKTPVVVRATIGTGMSAAAQHSQSPYNWVTAIPGLKVAIPATPADAKGLLMTAIRDDDPVVFLEHKVLYGIQGEVPEGEYLVPFGEARLARQGDHCTIVAWARMVHEAEAAAAELEKEGVTCDVVDPRTSSPLDEDTILESVQHTGRLVCVDELPQRCSLASEVAAIVGSKGFRDLQAPIELVTAPHTPIPFAPNLEQAYTPNAQKIMAAVKRTLA